MARQAFFIKLTNQQVTELNNYLNPSLALGGLRVRRRVQAILLSHQGWAVKRIAHNLSVSQRIIWKWFKIYKEKGIEGLKGTYFSHKL
jgi:hypothetical protein